MLALALSLAACSASDIPLVGDPKDRDIAIADVPGREEVVRGDKDPAIVVLNLKSGLRERRLSLSDELPDTIIVPTTNLNAVPITAALQAILAGTDISLSWNTGALGSRLVTVMNLRGPLSQVVTKVCSAARVFCTYKHGSIELSERETFVVSIPPIVRTIASSSIISSSTSTGGSTASPSSSSNMANNSIVEAINSLLEDGQKATVDEHGGNIVYTATVDVEERVSRYLSELRTERPLIVLQMYIWEVTLNRENSEGINWSSFQVNNIPSLDLSFVDNFSSAAATTGSMSLGAVTTGIISSSSVASFLATKGRVQTISNPQITLVSGSTASLRVGGTQRYISEVGTNVSSNVSGTTGGSSSNSSTNTVSTDSIDTGLSISVAGSYENGVVFANIDLSLKNLVGLNPTESGSGTIDLPETTDEKMNTVLRVRPGDSLVLAGLVTSNSSGTTQGMPMFGDSFLPFFGNDERSNRELVVIVKPSIVLFSDKEQDTPQSAPMRKHAKPQVVENKAEPRAAAPIKREQSLGTLSEPVNPTDQSVRPLSLTGETGSTSIRDAARQKQDSEEEVVVMPLDAFALPSDKKADDKSMESGFSHAFDKLLRLPGTSVDRGGGP